MNSIVLPIGRTRDYGISDVDLNAYVKRLQRDSLPSDFREVTQLLYPVRVDRIRVRLLAFFHFPAARWRHLRNSSGIESKLATFQQLTAKTQNQQESCRFNESMLICSIWQ